MGARDAKPAHADDAAGEAFLAGLGARVRDARTRRGLTRKQLAAQSAVSERYLAELEAGRGNMSVLLLRQVAATLGIALTELLREHEERALELTLMVEFLQRLPRARLARALAGLQREYGGGPAGRSERIALIGLRGAGKSTLGAALAANLKAPFIELDREIEREAGTRLSEIFLLYGQPGYRRYEHLCLEKVLNTQPRCVIATGGSIVSEAQTYALLRSSCFTVWLKAKPEEHMARVTDQGDMRPMAGNARAMADLKSILQTRNALYGQADAVVDTSGRSAKQSLRELKRVIAL